MKDIKYHRIIGNFQTKLLLRWESYILDRLAVFVNVAVLFKIFFTRMMVSLCSGASFCGVCGALSVY